MESDDSEEETDSKDNILEDNWFCNMQWKDFKNLQHMFIPIFPKKLNKDFNYKLNCELPYPIFAPSIGFKSDGYWMPFHSKLKKDRDLEYYRKLYSLNKNKTLVKDLKQKSVVCIPKYLIDAALESVDNHTSEVWMYTGGALDCIEINKTTFLANIIKPNTVRFADVNSKTHPVYFYLDDSSPIYNIKCSINSQIPVIGTRQKEKVSLFFLLNHEQPSVTQSWSLENANCFIDIGFNNINNQLCCVDAKHIAELRDFSTNDQISQHVFNPIRNNLSDHLAQILFLDRNIMTFMNRCCLFVLDWRSLTFFARCLREWLACDELCTISKKDNDRLYIVSTHNITELDIRSLKCVNKVMHMMYTPPFISSVLSESSGQYLSLLGQQMNDRLTTFHSNDLNIPQYTPTINDTLRITSSTRRLKLLELLQDRLDVPTLGMKLCKDPIYDDIIMYTSNSAGDVFQQRIFREEFEFSDAVNKFAEWTTKLVLESTNLEVTSICNLNKIVHSITTHFPNEKNLHTIMKKNTADSFWEKYSHVTLNENTNRVGEAVNMLWIEDVAKEGNIVSTQDKVMEWLNSTY